MRKTVKPIIAGILAIISGALGVPLAITSVHDFVVYERPFTEFADVFYLVLFIVALLISVLALVGGIFAVRRKRWKWALAGSIAAALTLALPLLYLLVISIPLGIPAVILVAVSKREFE